MNDSQILKVRKFFSDVEMQETIKSALRTQFLKKRTNDDVHILAAQTLAVQFLEEAWLILKSYKQEAKQENDKSNHGV